MTLFRRREPSSAFCASHSLAETYSTLTRIPPPHWPSAGAPSSETTPRPSPPATSSVRDRPLSGAIYFRRNGDRSRRILHCNVTEHPTAEWTIRQFKELLASDHSCRFVIEDRNGIFAPCLDRALKGFGVRALSAKGAARTSEPGEEMTRVALRFARVQRKAPARTPTASAFYERFSSIPKPVTRRSTLTSLLSRSISSSGMRAMKTASLEKSCQVQNIRCWEPT